MTSEWVFGYGSLATAPGAQARTAVLSGMRRTWGVAMDNRSAIPGYKRYLDPATGQPPALYVAFLDLVRDPAHAVNGVCRLADSAALAALDVRERQYARVDVSDRIAGISGRVWAYVGTPDGRARRVEGDRTGTVVVAAAYFDAVLAGFDALGPAARAAFAMSTDPCGCPVVDLVRVDLPAGQPPEPPAGS
jgi:hypothetical protein